MCRIGLARPFLQIYEARALRLGRHRLAHAGQTVTFSVHDRFDVRSIDTFPRTEGILIERIRAALRPHDTVFDVGANIGAMSLLLAAAAPPSVALHAFEPNPDTARRARANAALNPRLAVTVHELALGHENGNTCLYTNAQHSGQDSLVHDPSGRARHVRIQVERGDDFARRLGIRPSVVKIDVEGAEMDVLFGMEQLLRGSVRELFVEIHPGLLRIAHRSEDELVRWLDSRGFRPTWRQPRQSEIHAHFRR